MFIVLKKIVSGGEGEQGSSFKFEIEQNKNLCWHRNCNQNIPFGTYLSHSDLIQIIFSEIRFSL